MLEVKNLSVQYGGTPILRDIHFRLRAGEWLMVVGPNGAGKSTLAGALAQSVPYSGRVLLQNEDLAAMKPAARARKVGMLTQGHHVSYSFTVDEVVRLGRYAYAKKLFSPAGQYDEQAVQKALDATGMLGKRNRSVLTLSGGEVQRTFLAQLIAQDPALMLLDEPANHLDLQYQRQVFDLIGRWRTGQGKAVISVVHDLSIAKAYGTHALLLHNGNAAAFGPITEVLSAENLEQVYQMDVVEWLHKLLAQW